MLADDRFAELSSRTRHIDHVYGFLAEVLAGRQTAEWLALFERIDVPAMPLNCVDSLLDDPHIKAVELLTRVEHPTEGTLWLPRVPVDWIDHYPGPIAPAPRLGEHTVSLLQECGFDRQEVEAFLRSGAAVGGAPTLIAGIDLRLPLAAERIALVRRVWLEHGVVFLRDQCLTPDQFLAFARSIGTPVEYPFVNGIAGYSTIVEVKKLEHERVNFGGVWQTDTAYLDQPPMATLLLAREIPPHGGDTLFSAYSTDRGHPFHGWRAAFHRDRGRRSAVMAGSRAWPGVTAESYLSCPPSAWNAVRLSTRRAAPGG